MDEHSKCEIYTKSDYVVNAIKKQWLYKWRKNNWKTSSKTKVKNKELWEEIYNLLRGKSVKFKKI